MSGFSNSVIGGMQKLIRRAIQSPNFLTGVAGWAVRKDGSAEFQNVTLRGTFLGLQYILNNAGLFFYSGTPAHGNLVISIANAAGMDAFANAYQPGFVRYTGTGYAQIDIGGGTAILNLLPNLATHASTPPSIQSFAIGPGAANEQEQMQVTSGAAGGHNPVTYIMLSDAADASIGGSHSWIAGVSVTVFAISATQVTASKILFANAGLSVTGGISADTLNLTGTLLVQGAATLNGGLAVTGETTVKPQQITGNVVIEQTDSTTTSPITGTVATNLTKAWNIFGNDAQPNTVYRMRGGGFGVQGSTQEQLHFTVGFMGQNLGSDSLPATAIPASAAFEYKFDVDVIVPTTGATGTARAHGTFTVYEVGGPATFTAVIGDHTGVDVTVDTTGGHSYSVQANWIATTGAPTITGRWSTFARVGA